MLSLRCSASAALALAAAAAAAASASPAHCLRTMTDSSVSYAEKQWKFVLQQQNLLCNEVIKKYNETHGGRKSEGFCPPIWDGILCWNASEGGKTQTKYCPDYIYGFNSESIATKNCLGNGSWYTGFNDMDWTNYSQCLNVQSTIQINVGEIVGKDLSYLVQFLPSLKITAEVGYTISLISSLVAFTILVCVKKLRCPRNVLHMHLFASFIMRAFMSLLKDSLFVDGLATRMDILEKADGSYFYSEDQTNWLCKMIVSLWQYFIMANYIWILMEILYLHNFIFLTHFTESSSVTLLNILGWGLPFIFVIPWIVCRAFLDNKFCWTLNKNRMIFLLIEGPIAAATVVNFILCINISRVLVRTDQISVTSGTKIYAYRQWAKFPLTLLWLPVFHFVVFLGEEFTSNQTAYIVWLLIGNFFTSFDGFIVAILHCFLNGEVRREFTEKWNHFSFRELLENWHFLGANIIFSSVGHLRNDRHQDNLSYSSSAAGTVGTGCHDELQSRQEVVTCSTNNSNKSLDNINDSSQIENGFSSFWEARRWPSSSECDLEINALELKSMTTPNNTAKL